MKKLRVLSIFGTRPEAVKMAPVVQALSAAPEIESFVCVTAQHREMLDQVLDLFHIYPQFDLNAMRPNQTLSALTADLLNCIDPVLEEVLPDWILVQGDTTTVLAASLAAFYRGIKIGHVEAGLRTGDKHQPFPEEINRCVTGILADLHFAPTNHCKQNLLREGVDDRRIKVTGNTVIDALMQISAKEPPKEVQGCLDDWGISMGKRLILVTAHRRENFGKPIESICRALINLTDLYKGEVQIVYPVHLNPNVLKPVYEILDGVDNIHLTPPMDYLHLVHMISRSTLVLTDSGGIQEEASGLGIPTLVLRDKTERPEGVAAGVLKLVGTETQKILFEACNILDNPAEYAAMARKTNTFGDGFAAGRIVNELLMFADG